MDLDVSKFFPNISEESKNQENLESKMNVLLLGSYQPGIIKLMEMYKQKEIKPNKKLNQEKELLPTEKMLLLKKILEKIGHEVMIGNESLRGIRNVWNRLDLLIERADHIILLLKNQGGVLVEHSRITEKNQGYKTVNYVKEREQLSNVLLKGSFLLPQTKTLWYKDDKDLVDLVIRTTEAYNRHLLK